MAQRVNGVMGIIEGVVRDCELATIEDAGEWAKICARLERVADMLLDEGHVATPFAQLVSTAAEQVIDSVDVSGFEAVKQGILVLQTSCSLSHEQARPGPIDQDLMTQLQALVQNTAAENAAPLAVEEDAQNDENLMDLDDIDWKAVPLVDLDALEDQVAQEHDQEGAKTSNHHAQDEASDAGEMDDLLTGEAQEIRAQLSETGYIIFDSAAEEDLPKTMAVGRVGDSDSVAEDDLVGALEETIEETRAENEEPVVLGAGEKDEGGDDTNDELHTNEDTESEEISNRVSESTGDGLDVMAGAVSAFLEEDILVDQEDTSPALDASDAGDEKDLTDMAHLEEDHDDTFWTEAEPNVEPDLETPREGIAETVGEPVSENSTLAQLALDTMTLDLDDMSGLGRVHTQLETFVAELDGRPLAIQLTQALGVVIEKIILLECDDVADPLALICDGVAMLQQMEQEQQRGNLEKFTDDDLVKRVMQVAEIDLDNLGNGDGVEAEIPVVAGAEQEDAPIDVDQDIFFDFASEAEEHLETAESKLLELESHSEDKEVINAVFRSFHTIKGASGFLNLEDVTRVAHCVEDVLDSARKGTLTLTPSILDVALESLDLLAQLIGKTKDALENGKPVFAQDVTAFVAKVEHAATGKALPESQVDMEAPQVTEVEPAPSEAVVQKEEPAQDRRGQSREQSYVRVGTEKLDQLVNLVGELVIAQTQVSQNPDVVNTDNQKLTKDISQLMKISTDIQEISMSMRMVPIRSTFERMARIIRDLSRKCGKQVRFEMSGEDTELDKNVVEELVDPLTHMVRNAVDHGIEPEDDRVATGKNNQGSVHLNAYHKGGNIVIELRDDGKGLDRDKILKKAVERGLVEPGAQMSDEEVFALIFQAGFSTAEQISDISGRGVGMDVVRRNIEGLRGRVEVTSELGKGSVFTIRLPLTLAIIDGMVIGVGVERYILPMTAIVRSLRPEKDDVFYVMGKGEMIRVQEELLPIVRLYDRFGVPPTCDDIWKSLVVIVEAEGKRCGVMVDELLGMQQVVIKGLHDHLRNEPCLSGCAILGDGRVGLILDANGLVREGKKTDKKRDGQGVAYRSAS